MSDIFFTDAGDVPLPPEEVRIIHFSAEPRTDGRRVVLHFQLTPFQQKPNIEIKIFNQQGDEVASLNVVEAIENLMDFTVHLRQEKTGGGYKAEMRVFYSSLDDFELGEREDVPLETIFSEIEFQVVDTAECSFEINCGN
jgi:hypothetical protein